MHDVRLESDGQGEDQTRPSDDILHHKLSSSLLAKTLTSFSLRKDTASKRIGRRATFPIYLERSSCKPKWYVFSPRPHLPISS